MGIWNPLFDADESQIRQNEESGNQRIESQSREKHQSVPWGLERRNFSHREMQQRQFCLRHQVMKAEIDQNIRLKLHVQVLFDWKNIVARKLDFALEILATALCIELDFMRLCKSGFVFVFMPNAMQARFRRLAEVSRKAMLRRAIVVFYVPTYGNEQHHESHQKRAELKQAFFHGRKNTENLYFRTNKF